MNKNTKLDYFYEEELDQFTFYRIPKVFFTNQEFSEITTDAKLLYGLFLDRVSLSTKNQWIDDKGRVFIIFTLASIQKALGCSDKTATKLLVELEKKGLIERKKQGQGKPTIIYVKNFSGTKILPDKTRNNYDSGLEESLIQDSDNLRCSNTDFNNKEYSNTNLICSYELIREDYKSYFINQLDIEYLKKEYPYEIEIIDGILELILDTVTIKRSTIRIVGEEMSINIVKSRFMKLNSSHIRYVVECLKENTTKVRSMKQYLLAALFNAPITIGSYYQSLVNNDMASGKI